MFREFHHPDFSLTILRRRVADEILDLIACYGALAFRQRSFIDFLSFTSSRARDSALSRLRKAGIVVYRRSRTRTPILVLTDDARPRAHSLNPSRFWNQKWTGYWNVLMYDVPETLKSFRDSFRRVLSRLRLGCLQKSVWISPRDLRPEYDDLQNAIGIEGVSFLWEARTVLGRHADELVRTAWDMERLHREQTWFLREGSRSLDRIEDPATGRKSVEALIREELTAYLTVMERDPLLPRKLNPHDYRGYEVYDLHRRFVDRARRILPTRSF